MGFWRCCVFLVVFFSGANFRFLPEKVIVDNPLVEGWAVLHKADPNGTAKLGENGELEAMRKQLDMNPNKSLDDIAQEIQKAKGYEKWIKKQPIARIKLSDKGKEFEYKVFEGQGGSIRVKVDIQVDGKAQKQTLGKGRVYAEYDFKGTKYENMGFGKLTMKNPEHSEAYKVYGERRPGSGSHVFDILFKIIPAKKGLKMKHFKAQWQPPLVGNLDDFNKNILKKVAEKGGAQNLVFKDYADAAKNTWTGKKLASPDYNIEKVLKIEGEKNPDGTYKFVEIVFGQ